MVIWNAEQKAAIEKYKSLDVIPMSDRVYKCDQTGCKTLFKAIDLLPNDSCPNCKGNDFVSQSCPVDVHGCTHTNTAGVELCPVCGAFVCPDCGSHDVAISSRVTGYVSDLAGWNKAKQQEFTDRVRHTV